MPKTPAKQLAAKAAYNARPEMKKRRAENNAARREAMRQGLVKKGDGKDVGHRVALDNGGSNTKGNLKVQDRTENRGWRKGQSGYRVPNSK